MRFAGSRLWDGRSLCLWRGCCFFLVFYGFLPWFPPGRVSVSFLPFIRSPDFVRYTNLMTVYSLLKGELSLLLDSLRHLALPIFTLAFLSWALLMRIAGSSLLSELQQDYVTTARSKGLAERAVRR